jgi:hypothetical protein
MEAEQRRRARRDGVVIWDACGLGSWLLGREAAASIDDWEARPRGRGASGAAEAGKRCLAGGGGDEMQRRGLGRSLLLFIFQFFFFSFFSFLHATSARVDLSLQFCAMIDAVRFGFVRHGLILRLGG